MKYLNFDDGWKLNGNLDNFQMRVSSFPPSPALKFQNINLLSDFDDIFFEIFLFEF